MFFQPLAPAIIIFPNLTPSSFHSMLWCHRVDQLLKLYKFWYRMPSEMPAHHTLLDWLVDECIAFPFLPFTPIIDASCLVL